MFRKSLVLTACLCGLFLTACGTGKSTETKSMSSTVTQTQAPEQGTEGKQGESAPQSVVEGERAPDLTLMDKDGKEVSLKDYAGKKVYINFWASWCKPCLAEMPHIEKVYQKYKDNKDYVFLSVTSPKDAKFNNNYALDESQEIIMAAAKKVGITYPVLFDQKDNAMLSYGLRAFPSHIFINSDGTVNKVFSGELNKDTLEAGLKGLK
ncbi:TlpA family protein disulfide reductase [Streptococcus sp. S784/96/1]|uniref:TlpA family protein disulfide reductase n=1 Tax=Streptococcus sp. S784/96/1 TaxID=2653499 RepID=UPI0013872CB2|nr:TlpA disulfide reductase family protein [Streptococcus sp. S784/96/1]